MAALLLTCHSRVAASSTWLLLLLCIRALCHVCALPAASHVSALLFVLDLLHREVPGFADEQAAALAYDRAVAQVKGPAARLNFYPGAVHADVAHLVRPMLLGVRQASVEREPTPAPAPASSTAGGAAAPASASTPAPAAAQPSAAKRQRFQLPRVARCIPGSIGIVQSVPAHERRSVLAGAAPAQPPASPAARNASSSSSSSSDDDDDTPSYDALVAKALSAAASAPISRKAVAGGAGAIIGGPVCPPMVGEAVVVSGCASQQQQSSPTRVAKAVVEPTLWEAFMRFSDTAGLQPSPHTAPHLSVDEVRQRGVRDDPATPLSQQPAEVLAKIPAVKRELSLGLFYSPVEAAFACVSRRCRVCAE